MIDESVYRMSPEDIVPKGSFPGLEVSSGAEPRLAPLAITASGVLLIALLDHFTQPQLDVGSLYIFPIILAALYLPRWTIVLLALGCAALSEAFGKLPPTSMSVRMGFHALAFAGSGLLAGELFRRRRRDAARLKALAETSTAAMLTVDESGVIEMANRGAVELLAPRDGRLVDKPIAAFLPSLHHMLVGGEGPGFRASMQCVGHKGDGEVFNATVSYSTYGSGGATRAAAIIGNLRCEESPEPSSDEDAVRMELPAVQPTTDLSRREVEVLRCLVQGLSNKEIAARIAISESTVKNTIQQLFNRTGVRTRGQLVRVALQQDRNLL